jgi:putative hydrolase of the HAD superfamily
MNQQPPKLKTVLNGIRVISFDAGFTLIYPEPPVGEVYAGIARRFGYSLDPREVQTRFEALWKDKSASAPREKIEAFADEERAYRWWRDIFLGSLGEGVAPVDGDKMFPHCFHQFARGDHWRPYPEVPDTLKALRSLGFHLVMLSNWDRRLLQTLADLGLATFFTKIYISTLIGSSKPDPRAFQYGVKELGIPPRQILHIGDSWEEDILGAQRAGIRAIWLNRTGKSKSSHPQIPFISSLAELLC